MATYLQGVTDYVPQLQPFQPDLNLYANVLQTKQTQYDTAYKSLNKVYGQYFYADLTRDGNIERKDEILKNIDFNIKRISSLDLSLDQNVTQATQVFKPFYEDKHLMKDMAWTKNYNNQKGRANGLKNSFEEERRSQFWDTGVKAMDYKREEFKEASDEQALNFGNVSYTPYVNTMKKAQEIAKEAGLSIETVDFSKDGRWVIKTKNGDQLMEPLSKLFEAQLGSDPSIQEIYKTQAYVNRKDYAYSNAAQFGGDKNAAEMKYLENNFNMLKEQQQRRYEGLQDSSKTYDAKIKDIESQIAKGNKDPKLATYLKNLQDSKQVNDSVLERIKKDNESLSEQNSTVTTSSGFQNPYGDVESLRYKVDNAMSSILMEKDLNEAAEIFAFQNAKQDIEANPYAVNEQKHQFSMQETALRNAGLANAAKIRNAGERKTMIDKARLETGAYYVDENTGEVKPNEAYNNTFIDTENDGNVTDKVNTKMLSDTIAKRQTSQYAVPYLNQSMALLQKLKETGVMSDKEISKILSYKGKQVSWNEFNQKLQADPYKFLRSEIGSKDLSLINRRLNWWVQNNNKVSTIAKGIPDYVKASTQFSDYASYLEADNNWRKDTAKIVEQQLGYALDDNIKGYAKYLYDEDGRLRSKTEFNSLFNNSVKPKSGKSGSTIKNSMKDMGLSLVSPIAGVASSIYNYVTDEDKSDVYDELVKAASTAYSSGKIKKAPPGIATLGEMSGTGLFTPGRQSIYISPKGHGTKGNAYFHEFSRDFKKMDFGSPDKHQITFQGTSQSALKPEMLRNSTGKQLVDAIIMEMNNSKSKFTNFRMSAQSIVGNNPNKGAMILRPDNEWLQKLVYKTDKDGNKGAGIISEAQFNAIAKNGISVVSDSNNFSNGLFQSSYMDPIQSIVEYNGSYDWSDPYGNLKGSITKNKTGTGDYDLKTEYSVLDRQTGEYLPYVTYENMLTSGANLANRREDWLNMSEQIRSYNNGGY
jgi:hypothetical protein